MKSLSGGCPLADGFGRRWAVGTAVRVGGVSGSGFWPCRRVSNPWPRLGSCTQFYREVFKCESRG
jgi:hypothetical protein